MTIARKMLFLSIAAVLAGCFLGAAQAQSVSNGQRVDELGSRIEAQRRSGDSAGLATALALRAQAWQRLGHRREALQDLEAAAAIGATLGDERTAARIAAPLGQACVLAGRLDEGLRHLTRARSHFHARGEPGEEAAVANDLGLAYWQTGDTEAADSLFREAIALAEQGQTSLTAAKAYANLGRLLAAAGKPQAREMVVRSINAATAAPEPASAHSLVHAASMVLRNDGQPDDELLRLAGSALRTARDRAVAASDARAEAFATGFLGRWHERAGQRHEALDLTRRAIFLAQQAEAKDSLFMWFWQLARLHSGAAGEAAAALKSYERALAELRPIRSDLFAELRAAHYSYREEIGPLYLEYADLLLRQGRGQSDVGLKQARATIEQFKAVELEDYFQDDCVAAFRARERPVDVVEAGTAVLYPIVLHDRTEVLISLAQGLQRVVVPVAAAAMEEEALALRRLLEKRTTHEYLPHAQRLYDWLIAPLRPILDQAAVRTLVVVPDGALRNIPFAALHDGEAFLVNRYALATAPGLGLVEPGDTRRPRPLLNGITDSVQNFPALPFVAEEIDAIRRSLGGKTLENRDFVMPRFEAELKNTAYSVVHIAAHGQIDRDPRKSFVLAYDGKITMDDLERVMKLSRYRDEPVDLLTLSACRTAVGDERAALGLAGIAVKAGARSALATLWYVSDQASSILVGEFYRRLASGRISKAQALQQAQMQALADPRYRHPGYWAPFLLIGNWL